MFAIILVARASINIQTEMGHTILVVMAEQPNKWTMTGVYIGTYHILYGRMVQSINITLSESDNALIITNLKVDTEDINI